MSDSGEQLRCCSCDGVQACLCACHVRHAPQTDPSPPRQALERPIATIHVYACDPHSLDARPIVHVNGSELLTYNCDCLPASSDGSGRVADEGDEGYSQQRWVILLSDLLAKLPHASSAIAWERRAQEEPVLKMRAWLEERRGDVFRVDGTAYTPYRAALAEFYRIWPELLEGRSSWNDPLPATPAPPVAGAQEPMGVWHRRWLTLSHDAAMLALSNEPIQRMNGQELLLRLGHIEEELPASPPAPPVAREAHCECGWCDCCKAQPKLPAPPVAGALDRARAVMIRAMDALESDAELDARREAFEMIQQQFEGVSQEDHDRAESLIAELRASRPAAPATSEPRWFDEPQRAGGCLSRNPGTGEWCGRNIGHAGDHCGYGDGSTRRIWSSTPSEQE